MRIKDVPQIRARMSRSAIESGEFLLSTVERRNEY
jgi:hypothetical protein